jgi:glucosylceramidase
MMSYQNEQPSRNGEENPLLGSSNGNGASSSRSYAGRRYWIGVTAAFLLAVALLLNVVLPHTGQEMTVTVPTSPSIVYRPLCELHSDRFTIQGIESSMKDPSHPWSTIACSKAPTSLFRSPALAPLHSYGAPDAFLAVNLSHHAFPDRPPILGFGGAFTEASARNFQTLSDAGQEALLELLFGGDGLGYALGRIHMNSCDFSVASYSFDEVDGDFDLRHFDTGVKHDVQRGMVDFAKRAVSVMKEAWGVDGQDDDGDLRLYASPWSPPAWMKQPTWQDKANATHAAKMTFSTQPSCLRDGTGATSKYAAAWALYFSKYLTAYADLGLPFWGVTVQNEPEFPAPWEACSYTPMTEAEFVAYHLGPQLAQDHPDTKLLIFDHNKDHVNTWFKTILDNETTVAADYVDGTSYHWYAGGMDRLLDGALGIANLHRLQHQIQKKGLQKDHLVIGSEACHCPSTGYAGGNIGVYWSRAERYVHTVLADLAAGSNGWVEWNLLLDSIGGPNHLGNLCESPILAAPHRAINASHDIPTLPDFEAHGLGDLSVGEGRTREELNSLGFPAKYLDVGLVVQPIYFYMGHIARFVRPGSQAVPGLVTQGPGGGSNRIFQPEGSVVVGGGQNDLARDGMEVAVWPCEGSTRQQFSWHSDIDKNHIVVHGHDWLGQPTTSCVAKAEDEDFLGVRLVGCKSRSVGVYEVQPVFNDTRVRLVLKNHKSGEDRCLVIRNLLNSGGAYGPRGGAQVTIGSCGALSALWNVDGGEFSSLYLATKVEATGQARQEEAVCMTTGWPFLQMGAFSSSSHKTVVILNEASDPANYALVDDGSLVLTGNIPARSVQTFRLENSSE